MTPSINRRTFLGSTIFIPGIVPRLMAQDARSAGMSEPAQTTMPPVKLASWTRVRDCFEVGERAPQDEDGPISEVYSLDRRERMGEDCLKINIYNTRLRKRPPPRHGMAARRRLCGWVGKLVAIRRNESCA